MALRRIHHGDTDAPLLDMIEMPWGFRLRPANMQNDLGEAIVEWALTFLGIALLLAAFAQWLLPSSLYQGDTLITMSDAYPSAFREGVMVTVKSVLMLADGNLDGDFYAKYDTEEADSMLTGTLKGMRK